MSADIQLIDEAKRLKVFNRLSIAQRFITRASADLGEGHQEVRELMVESQRALAAAVSALWNIGGES